MSFVQCTSQSSNVETTPIEFEEVNHYPYELIPEKFKILDTQQKMDVVFSTIHSKSEGNRLAPIPNVNPEETYLIFKTSLQNSNDVEVKKIEMANNTLLITLQQFDNPQIEKNSRVSPNILVKLLKKIAFKNVIINTPKN